MGRTFVTIYRTLHTRELISIRLEFFFSTDLDQFNALGLFSTRSIENIIRISPFSAYWTLKTTVKLLVLSSMRKFYQRKLIIKCTKIYRHLLYAKWERSARVTLSGAVYGHFCPLQPSPAPDAPITRSVNALFFSREQEPYHYSIPAVNGN